MLEAMSFFAAVAPVYQQIISSHGGATALMVNEKQFKRLVQRRDFKAYRPVQCHVEDTSRKHIARSRSRGIHGRCGKAASCLLPWTRPVSAARVHRFLPRPIF